MSVAYQIAMMAQVLEKELEYNRKVVKEQQEIIEQLTGTGQPKGYVYMHPFDVAELFNKLSIVDIYIVSPQPDVKNLIYANGRQIKQSPHIPAVSKNFK